MTFSITARCRRTGMFGVAVSSSSPAVAARCAHARAGVGAVATQNITDPRLGPAGLDRLAEGLSADDALAALCAEAGDTAPYRQLTVVDAEGHSAAWTGHRSLGRHAHWLGSDVAAAGNMLSNLEVPAAMGAAFLARPDIELAERILLALEAALDAGGEEGAVHSAGILIVDRQSWPLVDLRIDWSTTPIAGLRALWAIWEPQMHDYVTRGLNPALAPSYGVPGDL